MPTGIVVVTLQNIAESRSRVAVHQVVTHRSLKSFQFAFVPGHEDLRILDVGADLQACSFEVAGMELSGIIDNDQFRHAVALPPVLDPRKLALDIRLRENCVFEASHHR